MSSPEFVWDVAKVLKSEVQALVAGERDYSRNVGRGGTPYDHLRPSIDHRVPDLAGAVVRGVAGRDHLALHPLLQCVERGMNLHRLSLQSQWSIGFRRHIDLGQRHLAPAERRRFWRRIDELLDGGTMGGGER